MPATLGALLANPHLGLRLLTDPGADSVALAAPIRWVATSELVDPTPYLQGGELLLTTGLRLPRGKAQVAAYVDRLLDAGVVGVGYGVGLVTATVPAALVRVAGERGLPLIEVDQPTPFIAVSKAVSDLLTAEQYAEVTRGFTGQQALTRAAVTGRAAGVVSRLAATLDGWAALLERDGQVRYASPASARPSAAAVTGELNRLRGRRHAALALVQGDSHVVVHPLTPSSGGRGFLVVGIDHAPGATDRSLINVATALLSLDLEQAKIEQTAARSAALLRLLLDGIQLTEEVLIGLGGSLLASQPLLVTAFAGEAAAIGELLRDLLTGLGDHVLAAVVDGDLIAITASRDGQDFLMRSVPDGGGVAVGTSRASRAAEVAEAIRHARQAAASARHFVPAVLDYDQIRTMSAVNLVELPALSAYTDSLLGPLDEYARASGIDLVASLGAWLEHHGQYDPAAVSLQIHRHTLRYRVQKAEALLGRDLTTADARMELWFAITARRQRLSTPANQTGR
ncbi:PucR family transcriptional regulator [Planosporangium thailandense]|uniref:PucR family transcriptional regulator n=1 Tax=Planosporangium thailandense TaxID=765197 RepID=A0ABX0Y4D2_9ACTN|nr:PucR family transcriptional regulator [Planosporangium thailandense]NJC73247.1 PucR family transcriptional regulator [Planosporangium thailandense]